MKIAGREIGRSELAVMILFPAFLVSVVGIRILTGGLDMKDILMVFGIVAIGIVLSCMLRPEKAQIIVKKNSKTIYAVFMLLIAPIFMIVAVKMAGNAISGCCSEYSLWQALGAVGGIGAVLILSSEIVPYGAIYIKIKKAIGY
ncbi:MAG: hypothetical protein WC788_06705 [Candidatus Paceibacterota bacterium]